MLTTGIFMLRYIALFLISFSANAVVFSDAELSAGLWVPYQGYSMTCGLAPACGTYTGGSAYTTNMNISQSGVGCGFPVWSDAVDSNVKVWFGGTSNLSTVTLSNGSVVRRSVGNGAIIVNKQVRITDSATGVQTILNPATYMGDTNSAYRLSNGQVQAYDASPGIPNVKLQFVGYYANVYSGGAYYDALQSAYLRVMNGTKSYFMKCYRGF
jgi:hypothetical protein